MWEKVRAGGPSGRLLAHWLVDAAGRHQWRLEISNATYVHWLDRNDRIVTVSDEWRRFASENGAPDLPDLVIGRLLWDFVDESAQSHDWRSIFQGVRETVEPAWIPHRADSPDVLRVAMMAVFPSEDRGLVVKWWFTREEPRDPEKRTEARRERGGRANGPSLQGSPVRGACLDSILFLCQEVGGWGNGRAASTGEVQQARMVSQASAAILIP